MFTWYGSLSITRRGLLGVRPRLFYSLRSCARRVRSIAYHLECDCETVYSYTAAAAACGTVCMPQVGALCPSIYKAARRCGRHICQIRLRWMT